VRDRFTGVFVKEYAEALGCRHRTSIFPFAILSNGGDGYTKSPENLGGVTGGVYIALEGPTEIDAAYARAKAAGADITRELEDTDYESREFGVRDPEGHVWSFGTYRPQAE
jgi:uncharacterized glyoxalase superfamily protein PhnB